MKKRVLTLLLIVLCLLTVACGKKKGKEEEGEKTIKCVSEFEDQKVEYVLVVDTRTGEVSKTSIKMTVPKSFYASFNYTDEQLIEALCKNDAGYYDSCEANIEGSYVNSSIDYNPKKYQEELEKEFKVEKIDKSILEQMKQKSEANGSSCTIS